MAPQVVIATIFLLRLCAPNAAAAGISNTALSPMALPQAGGQLTVSATIAFSASGAASVTAELYANGVDLGYGLWFYRSAGNVWTGSTTIYPNYTSAFNNITAKITAVDNNGSTYTATTSTASVQAFDSVAPTIGSAAASATTVTAASQNITITAKVSETGAGLANVYADLAGQYPTAAYMSRVGTSNVFTGSVYVPANSTANPIILSPSVTAYDYAGNHSSVTLPQITQLASTVNLAQVTAAISGAPVTTVPAAGATLTVGGNASAAYGISQFTCSPYCGTDGAGGTYLDYVSGTQYQGSITLPPNRTAQTRTWTLVFYAAAGAAHSSKSITLTQPPIGITILNPTLSVGGVPATTVVANGGPITVSADIISPAGIGYCFAQVFNRGNIVTQGELNLTTGDTYSATLDLGPNTSVLPANCKVLIFGSNDKQYSTATIPFTQEPDTATVTDVALDTSAVDANGGNVSINATVVYASTANAAVYAEIHRNGFYYQALQLTNAGGNTWTGSFATEPNADGSPAEWTVTAIASLAYASGAWKTSAFSQPSSEAIGTPPTLSNLSVRSLRSVPPAVSFGAAGDTATFTATSTNEDGVAVIAYANGQWRGQLGLTPVGSTNTLTGSLPISANGVGSPLSWTFVFVSYKYGSNTHTMTAVGPYTQAYTPPTLAGVSAAPSAIPATGGAVSFVGKAFSNVGASGLGVAICRDDIWYDYVNLSLPGGNTNGNGPYTGTYTLPGNTTGKTNKWTFEFQTNDNYGNVITSTVVTRSQAFARPTITGISITPTPFAASGSLATATYTAAASDGNASYGNVYMFRNGLYVGPFDNLHQAGGATSGNGTYSGTATIDPNVSGTSQIYTFLLQVFDNNGTGYANEMFGPITQPYSPPAVTGTLTPSILANSGGDLTVNVNATGAGIQGVYAYLYQDGSAVPTPSYSSTLSQAGGATSGPGAYSGTITIPANATGTEHHYTVLVVTTDGGAISTTNLGPVTQGPQLLSVTPTSAVLGTSFPLTVNGSGFDAASVVYWNLIPLTTSFVSSTQLNASVTPAANVPTSPFAPSASVLVINADGTHSPIASVSLSNPTPILTALRPVAPAAGAANASLTVSGSLFVPGAVVKLNGTALKTTFGTSSSLVAVLPVAALTGGGAVTVTNPTPGGGTSGSLSLPALSINAAGFVVQSRSKTLTQVVTITNSSPVALNGPIVLSLQGLSSNATLTNASGYVGPTPYVTLQAGSLAAGASVSVTLTFSDPTLTPITYTPVATHG
jgi:hypothetical protein